MWKAEGLFSAISFGFDLEHLFLRLDPDTSLLSQKADLRIECWLQTPAHSYRLEMSLASPDHYVVSERRDDGGWQEVSRSARIAWHQVLELALPFKELHVEEGQILQMTVIVRRDGLEIARYPRHQPAALSVPGPEFEATVWRV
jgi:hypothetical protein